MTTPPPTPPPSSPAPPPSGPAPAPRTTSTTRSLSIPPLLLAALIGAIVVIGASFAPWVSSSTSDEKLSGWQLYDDQVGDKENAGFYFDRSFGKDDSPFFTGLSTIIAGAAVGIVALALMVSRGSANDSIGGVFAFLGITAGILVLVVGGTNLVSYLRKAEGVPADLEWGLILVWVGAVVSAAIIPASLTAGGARAPSRL